MARGYCSEGAGANDDALFRDKQQDWCHAGDTKGHMATCNEGVSLKDRDGESCPNCACCDAPRRWTHQLQISRSKQWPSRVEEVWMEGGVRRWLKERKKARKKEIGFIHGAVLERAGGEQRTEFVKMQEESERIIAVEAAVLRSTNSQRKQQFYVSDSSSCQCIVHAEVKLSAEK